MFRVCNNIYIFWPVWQRYDIRYLVTYRDISPSIRYQINFCQPAHRRYLIFKALILDHHHQMYSQNRHPRSCVQTKHHRGTPSPSAIIFELDTLTWSSFLINKDLVDKPHSNSDWSSSTNSIHFETNPLHLYNGYWTLLESSDKPDNILKQFRACFKPELNLSPATKNFEHFLALCNEIWNLRITSLWDSYFMINTYVRNLHMAIQNKLSVKKYDPFPDFRGFNNYYSYEDWESKSWIFLLLFSSNI